MGSGIQGRSTPHGQGSMAQEVRVKERYDSVRYTHAVTFAEYSVRANLNAFKSEEVGDTYYSSTLGFDRGNRHNIRIYPTTNAIWVKFPSSQNSNPRPVYIPPDAWFEIYNIECNDLLISSADSTAQSQIVTVTADTAGSLNNKYFKGFARNNVTGEERTFGFWYNVSSGGTQPTDSSVDQWREIDISTNDTNATVGTATEAVIEATSWGSDDVFDSSVSTAAITIVHDNAHFGGGQKKFIDGAAPTGFTFAAPTAGGASTVVQILAV